MLGRFKPLAADAGQSRARFVVFQRVAARFPGRPRNLAARPRPRVSEKRPLFSSGYVPSRAVRRTAPETFRPLRPRDGESAVVSEAPCGTSRRPTRTRLAGGKTRDKRTGPESGTSAEPDSTPHSRKARASPFRTSSIGRGISQLLSRRAAAGMVAGSPLLAQAARPRFVRLSEFSANQKKMLRAPRGSPGAAESRLAQAQPPRRFSNQRWA